MMVSVEFLDFLYRAHHEATARLASLSEVDTFPDDGYSSRIHESELERAKLEKMRTKNTIIEYIEAHGKA